jgi:hypothetical protein
MDLFSNDATDVAADLNSVSIGVKLRKLSQDLQALKRGQSLILDKLRQLEEWTGAFMRVKMAPSSERTCLNPSTTDGPSRHLDERQERGLTRPCGLKAVATLSRESLAAIDRFFFAAMGNTTWLDFDAAVKTGKPHTLRCVRPLLGFQVSVYEASKSSSSDGSVAAKNEAPDLFLSHRACAALLKTSLMLDKAQLEMVPLMDLTVGEWAFVGNRMVKIELSGFWSVLQQFFVQPVIQLVTDFLLPELQHTWTSSAVVDWPLTQQGSILWNTILPNGTSLIRDLFDFVCSKLEFKARLVDKRKGTFHTFSTVLIEFHSCLGNLACSVVPPLERSAGWPLARVVAVGLTKATCTPVDFEVEKVETTGACKCEHFFRAGFLTPGLYTEEKIERIELMNKQTLERLRVRAPCSRCKTRHTGMCRGPFSLDLGDGRTMDCGPQVESSRRCHTNLAMFSKNGCWNWAKGSYPQY